MENKQIGIVAVAVVAILLVAGVGVAVVSLNNNNGENDKSYKGISTGCNLWVYGNANGDDKLDQKDVDLLQDIVDGKAEQKYVELYDGYNAVGGNYAKISFADANRDGVVNADDVDKVKEIIAFQTKYANAVKNGTLDGFSDKLTIYYENCDLGIAKVSLPIKKLGVVYYTNSEVVRLLGATDRVVLSDNTTINNHTTMLPEYLRGDITNVGNTRFYLDAQKLLNDYTNKGMTALFTGSASTYSGGIENNLKVDGKTVVDVIRLPAWEDNNFMAGTLTLGYMLGATEKAYAYIEWAEKYTDMVAKALDGVECVDAICAKGRTDSLLAGNGNGSGRSEITQWAGAYNLVTTLKPVSSEYPDINKEWALSVNPQYIILSASAGYEKSSPAAIKSAMTDVYKAAADTYKGTDAEKNGKIILVADDIFTGPAAIVGMLYIAKLLHPDRTADIDADKAFQEYVDTFGLGSTYKVSEHMKQFICTSA